MSLINNTEKIRALIGSINALPDAGSSDDGPYSMAELITWTPAETVEEATISHSLGVAPDGFYAVPQSLNYTAPTGRYNVFSYTFDARGMHHDGEDMCIAAVVGIQNTEINLSVPVHHASAFCTAQNIKMIKNTGGYTCLFPAGTTYEILVYKR